jgi:mitochondrial fusion and transport protein UGO1
MVAPVATARHPPPQRKPIPLVIPHTLILPTIINAVVPNYLSSLFTLTFRPYFPRVSFSQARYSLPFLASFLDLGVRLPFESVLRRAQISHTRPERTVVRVGAYTGVLGTMWSMLVEETGGIFRGWRVGVWGLLMVWVLKTTDSLGRGHVVEF